MRLPGRCSAPWVSVLSGLWMLKGPLVDLQDQLAEQRRKNRKVVHLAQTQLVPVSTPTLASSPAGAPIPPNRLIPSLFTMVIERQNHSITSPEAQLRPTAWRGVTRGHIVLIHHLMSTTFTVRMLIITLVIIITTEITTTLAITENTTVLIGITDITPMKLIFITLITETIRVLAIIIIVQKATIQSIPITVETISVQVIITIMGTIIV